MHRRSGVRQRLSVIAWSRCATEAWSRPLPYLMYPLAEFGDTVMDGRDPAAFRFRIVSRKA